MIERYTRPEMGQVWELHNRFTKMMEVEIAVAEAQAELKIIPTEAAQAIAQKAGFDIQRIHEIEKTTKHDVIAFVSAMAEKVGEHGRYIHFGMTSSDVLDTALSLQVRDACNVLHKGLERLAQQLKVQAKQHSATLCAGRTHGMHAEPTSFGLKMAGFWVELQRNQERLKRAEEQLHIGKLSGAVGTYSTLGPELEAKVCQKLQLTPELIATQVIPRDRHAELFFALALLGAGVERIAVELRHLQRTEVYEVIEGFSKGQKGSSAMPHKKNPISSENLTGCARLLRAYAQAALENVALWHERDISHSSVERVALPDAFILADYAVNRMADVIEQLHVDQERMLQNMDLSQGQLFSSHLLLAFVEKGLSREQAYALTQRLSHSLAHGEHLKQKVLADSESQKYLKASEVENIFSGSKHKKSIEYVIERAMK